MGSTVILTLNACKRTNNDKYFYNPGRDTIAPSISVSVPKALALYNYGQDIHFVGTVIDLESKNKGGKLKELNLTTQSVDANGNVIKTYFVRTPNVDGKEGYTFNEKLLIPSGTGEALRFSVYASDYAGRSSVDTVYFSIN